MRKFYIVLPLRLCIFACLISAGVFAQSDSSKALKTVPVFAYSDSISRIAVMSSGVPHFVLNEEKLNELAVTDIGSAMKFIPGIQLKDYGGIGGIKTVSFRSLGATHTGVTVDGIRIPNVQSGSINLSSFEIFGVDELSFSTGQTEENSASASAYLNANSISVKSILVKKPEKINLRIYSNASTISSFEEGILCQVPVTKNLFFGFQGVTKFGNGDYVFRYEPGGNIEPQRRTNSALFNYKLRAVAGLYHANSQTLFSANYFNNEQELPGAMILYNPSNDQKLWSEDLRISVLHNHKKRDWKFQVNAFYQSAFLRYFDPDFLNLQGFIDDSYLQQNGGGGFMIKRRMLKNKLEILSGSDLIYSDLRGSSLITLPERIESNSVVGLSGWFGRFKIESNLTLQLISDKAHSNDSVNTRSFNELSPFISVAWIPFKKSAFKIRTFYKRAFTMPTFNDLYYNFIGNSTLKPETANMFNAGFTIVQKNTNWYVEMSMDAFYNRVENKILAIPTKDLFNWSMQNIGMINARGFDIAALLSYKKNKWRLTTSISYTYNLSLDLSDAESTTFEHQIPYTPFHAATGGVICEYSGYRANVNILYTGFRYSLNENIYANYLDPFTDISVNFSKEIIIRKKIGFTCIVAAHNLLNKNYEVIRSFPMPGRYYQFTLQIKLK